MKNRVYVETTTHVEVETSGSDYRGANAIGMLFMVGLFLALIAGVGWFAIYVLPEIAVIVLETLQAVCMGLIALVMAIAALPWLAAIKWLGIALAGWLGLWLMGIGIGGLVELYTDRRTERAQATRLAQRQQAAPRLISQQDVDVIEVPARKVAEPVIGDWR